MHQHLSIYVTDRSLNGNLSLKRNLEGYGNVLKVYTSCEPVILPLEIIHFREIIVVTSKTEVTNATLFIIEKKRSLSVQKGGLVK